MLRKKMFAMYETKELAKRMLNFVKSSKGLQKGCGNKDFKLSDTFLSVTFNSYHLLGSLKTKYYRKWFVLLKPIKLF